VGGVHKLKGGGTRTRGAENTSETQQLDRTFQGGLDSMKEGGGVLVRFMSEWLGEGKAGDVPGQRFKESHHSKDS